MLTLIMLQAFRNACAKILQKIIYLWNSYHFVTTSSCKYKKFEEILTKNKSMIFTARQESEFLEQDKALALVQHYIQGLHLTLSFTYK